MSETENVTAVVEPYVINSYGVSNELLSEGAALVRESGLRHVAFIMDGNGRWATARGLPRESGHKEGMVSFEQVAEYCADIGIRYVTVYAFSTENWKRPKHEVNAILMILRRYLKRALKLIDQKRVHFVVIGDISPFDEKTQQLIRDLDEKSACYDRVLNIALNYGGRAELVHAMNEAVREKTEQGVLSAESMLPGMGELLTEDDIERHLYTYPCPPPDMIVRTAGDKRLSNFLLWQSSYSELMFSPVLWPDYRQGDVNDSIRDFLSRQRRYGGVESTVGVK